MCQRLLNYIKPDFVHIIADGKIVKSGDYSLAMDNEVLKLEDDMLKRVDKFIENIKNKEINTYFQKNLLAVNPFKSHINYILFNIIK